MQVKGRCESIEFLNDVLTAELTAINQLVLLLSGGSSSERAISSACVVVRTRLIMDT